MYLKREQSVVPESGKVNLLRKCKDECPFEVCDY